MPFARMSTTFAHKILLLAIAFWSASQVFGQIETVKVAGGQLRGVVKEGIASFKGIPFAAPPVGALRWKTPQPVQPWTGVKNADSFAPAPIQPELYAKLLGATSVSEDCLYLNVWTPAKRSDEKLPVMVWIHGGALVAGATGDPTIDGTKLARKGVVLVTVAYRLGPFGFLAHPLLSAESGKGSGNYGIQDQIAGLRWVKENIAQFGGDPLCVTIFGESAGAISVSILVVAPPAKGLFHRAIAQSGVSMAAFRQTDEGASATLPVRTLKAAEALGDKLLAKLSAKDIEAARAASADAVQKAADGWSPMAVEDGEIIIGDPYELYQAGRFHDTPVLAGFNSDDGGFISLFYGGVKADVFEKNVRSGLGPAGDAVLAQYPHATDAQADQSTRDMVRDLAFGWPTWAWAGLQTKMGKNKAYVYYMDHLPSSPVSGVAHGAEVPYVFGNLGGYLKPSAPEDFAVSDKIGAYWVHFAKSGDPNGPGLPTWPAFDEKSNDAMIFGKTIEPKTFPNRATIQALDVYFAWLRAQAKAK
jgi:para-nitrobenzyl esterase